MLHYIRLFVISLLLVGCESPSIEPPSIDVDLIQLAPEASSAIKVLQAKVKTHPDDVKAWRELGMLYHAHGLEEAAILAYNYVGSTTNDPQAIYLQAIANARLGEYDEALRLAAKVSSNAWTCHCQQAL